MPPRRPRPQVNMPVMVPVRYASRIALPKFVRAAAATRTLPAVASRMPVNPTAAEKSAPIRNAIPRPTAMVSSSAVVCIPRSALQGHFDAMMTPVRMTISTPTTVNCRRK